ncbi:MAG: 2-hydroxyacid dehydrogenase [Dehalococcoidia bacterium]
MKTLVYSTRPYDKEYLEMANRHVHKFHFYETRLERRTAALAAGFPAICCFVDDELDASVLKQLSRGGTKLITLRSTGFNNVDLVSAEELGLTVMRVSQYSPYAVAEFATGLILALSRKIHRAYNRVREGNFLLDGLLGFDLHGKTVGIVGTGKIGSVLTQIMNGFGCRLLGYDVNQNKVCLNLGMSYVPLNELLAQSDIVSLHAPLTPETRHMINKETLSLMKPGAMLVNTSRGALVDTKALLSALKKQKLGAVGMDVYEEESHIYYQNLSEQIIPDDVITRLTTFPNVLITGHQAFFTCEALTMIAETTIQNISDFKAGRTNENIVEAKNKMKKAS